MSSTLSCLRGQTELLACALVVTFGGKEHTNVTINMVPNTSNNRVPIPSLIVGDNEALLTSTSAMAKYIALRSKKEKRNILLRESSVFAQSEVEMWLEWEASNISPTVFKEWILYAYGEDDSISESAAESSRQLVFDALLKLESVVNNGPFSNSTTEPTLAALIIFSDLYAMFADDSPIASIVTSKAPKTAAWFRKIAVQSFVLQAIDDAGVSRPSSLVIALTGVEAPMSLTPLPEKPIYITTPIYYVNGEPHIGHVYTTLLADMLALWYRQRGAKVMFSTGTDEHGQKVAQSAEKKGIVPKQFCDEVSAIFKELFDKLGFTYDRFIRTTDSDHRTTVLEMWRRLKEKGLIYKGVHEGWYSVSDEAFLTELQVAPGIDPKTGEECTVSLESGHKVEWMVEENYKFKLSAMEQPLLDWLDANPDVIVPQFRWREIRSFIAGGLRDLSVSRTTVTWGIKIPEDPKHTMYVWLDALTNYLTTAGLCLDSDAKPLWPADYQIVGKDILRFHAVYWPAFLIGADLPTPRRIVAHGWWTKDKQKISKSLGNCFDPLDTVRDYGLDPLRYFLLREGSLHLDGDYTDETMVAHLNSPLADAYGNLVARAISRTLNPSATVPACGVFTSADKRIVRLLEGLPGKVDYYLSNADSVNAIQSIWAVIMEVNKFITIMEPWVLRTKDPVRCGTVLYIILEAVRIFAYMTYPFMPTTSTKILDQLGVPASMRRGDTVFSFGGLHTGDPLGESTDILFTKKTLASKDK